MAVETPTYLSADSISDDIRGRTLKIDPHVMIPLARITMPTQLQCRKVK